MLGTECKHGVHNYITTSSVSCLRQAASCTTRLRVRGAGRQKGWGGGGEEWKDEEEEGNERDSLPVLEESLERF
jgi:hypothetical protein